MILFSDLHLSPKTFDTSMSILRVVHSEALARNITVGFLGDFFDHVYNKGTLPVDILNELMRFFCDEWRVPMIMIPGNHDYFDASETEHGLTPFKYASKWIKVIDVPTVIDECLWVPWRRDPNVCKEIIESHPNVKIIFGHFDIIGFKLNAKRISTEGCTRQMFPSNINVYTGHYHTPQQYDNITYLGSPYQLTLSEAEDKKALIIINESGKITTKIPIDIGPKQYKWQANDILTRHKELRANDRVSLVSSEGTVEIVHSLRQRGVIVNVRANIVEAETRIRHHERLSELELLKEFANIQSIDQTGQTWEYLTDKLNQMTSLKDIDRVLRDVIPIKMCISAFGPFVGPLTVPLQSHGFTLVSGSQTETGGSNGSGKSMVTAGALLWVFTGSLDGRSSFSFETGSSIVHKGEPTACVEIYGTTNGLPFKIVRKLSESPKKHIITFSVNGIDRTRSTISATQRAISEDIFGKTMSGQELWSWLVRISCWSQQSVVRFCNAGDAQAKKEIQTLANMKLWISLHDWAREEFKLTKMELEKLELETDFSQKQLDIEVLRLNSRKNAYRQWQENHERSIENYSKEIETMRLSIDAHNVPSEEPVMPSKSILDSYKRNLLDARDCMIRLKTKLQTIIESLPKNWNDYIQNIPQKVTQEDVKHYNTKVIQCQATAEARRAQLNASKEAFKAFKQKGYCLECHRPFDNDPNRHTHLSELEAKIELATSRHSQSIYEANTAKRQAEKVNKQYKDYQTYLDISAKQIQINEIRQSLDQSSLDELKIQVDELIHKYEVEKKAYDEYSQKLSTRNDLLRALDSLNRIYNNLITSENPHNISEDEVLRLTSELNTKEKLSKEKRIHHKRMKDIVQWTGYRGIQTYVMENTLQKLAAHTTLWLERFFGTEAHMVCSFDSKERLIRQVIVPGFSGVMSGGQWRRVELASFMAWRSMVCENWPLLIMDECCQQMDQPGIQNVQETLREWCTMDPKRTCYFITHEGSQHRDTSIYQNHIQIQRKRGRSSMIDVTHSNYKKQKL